MMSPRIAAALALAISLCFTSAAETISDGSIHVQFNAEDSVYAARALETLTSATAEFASQLPAGDAPITAIICRTPAEFRQLAGPHGRIDIAGFARPYEGLIVVHSPVSRIEPYDYHGVLRHELIHVLLARNTQEGYMPRWLNEGLSMRLSGEYRWRSVYHVGRMYADGRLMRYDDLSLVFTTMGEEGQFGDAYAQSLSMTKFLQEHLKDEEFWGLIHDMRSIPFGEALIKHTRWTPNEFWDAWRASMWRSALLFSTVSGVTLFQIGALLLVAAWWRKKRKAKRLLAQWDEDENEPLAPWEVFDQEEQYPWEEDEEDTF
jgi:hypothetical protein